MGEGGEHVQENARTMIKFGVVGFGYWGPNVVRNLAGLEGVQVVSVADKSAAARRRIQKAYPAIRVTDDSSEFDHRARY